MDDAELAKLRKISDGIKRDLETCQISFNMYKDAEDGGAYAQQYELSTKYLKRYVAELEEAFPELENTDSEKK